MGKRRSRGEGSIFKRADGLWVGQIRIDGKKKVKYSKVQKEVRDWLHAQREAVNQGVYIDSKDITLSAFLEQYMASQMAYLRPRTAGGYLTLIRQHINPELGSVKLTQLRADMIQNFYARQLETYSKRTVQYMHAVLHKALDQAVKFGLVARNVTDLVDSPTPAKKTPTIWTVEQSKKFLVQVRPTKYYPMFCLAYLGLREGELLGLFTENFNRENHTVTIDHDLQYVAHQGLVIQEPKSKASVRTIKLPDFVYQALCEHLDQREGNPKHLFTTSTGTAFHPRFFNKKFKELLKAAGLPEIRLHDLRHFFISHSINDLHISPAVVQSIVGHASPMLTLSVYTHSTTQQQNEVMEKIGDEFK